MTTSPGRGLLVGRTIGAGAVRRPPQPVRHRQLLNRHDDDALARLTDREREVLNLMAQGRSNSAISEQIHCSAKTLETHIRSIFTKLDLHGDPADHRHVAAVIRWLHGRSV